MLSRWSRGGGQQLRNGQPDPRMCGAEAAHETRRTLWLHGGERRPTFEFAISRIRAKNLPDAVFIDASQLFASLGQAAPAAGSVVGGQAGLALPCARRHVSRRINESAERRASIRGAISCAGCCGSHRAQNPGWNSARQCTCALLGGENGCVRNSRSPARARPFLDAVGWAPTSNRLRLECSKRNISKK